MAVTGYRLSDRYTRDEGTVFMTGIQALARLPIEQLRVDRDAGHDTAALVTGYPGSPVGGYDKAVAAAAATVPDLPVRCRPAVNEELAATAIMGSQLAASRPDALYDGVVGIWYGKAPGVDRAGDAMRHGVFAGTSRLGGVVVLAGDDPAAKSSTLPSSSAAALADRHIPLLYPGDVQEALDLGRHAIALSRLSGLWVGLKIVADVADGSGTVDLHPHRLRPRLPDLGDRRVSPPDGNLLTPHTIELEREIFEVRYELATEYASLNALNDTPVDPPDAWIGIVASGYTYHELRDALRILGLGDDRAIAEAGIRLLRMQMPIPFDPSTMRRFARGLDEILVVEEKAANVESLVKDALYSLSDRPRVVGKRDENDDWLVRAHADLDVDAIVPVLRRRLSGRLGDRLAPPPPAPRPRIAVSSAANRTPAFCSGCPHSWSTRVPDGALVGAGIGCHTMILLMPEDRVGEIAGLTAMGGEGAQWIGMADFVGTPHLFQNVGDGTFFHSAQVAIEAAVDAGVNITYKLLHNGAVAMTGGQRAPGSRGIDDICRLLLAHGVARIIVTTDDVEGHRRLDLPDGVEVWDRHRVLEAQETLARVPGVTVLVHDQQCAAEARRARKRGLVPTPDTRVAINHRICEGCGDCGDVSACLSVQPVETAFGRKTTIDQTSCNFDYHCLDGDCPAFMVVSRRGGGRLRRWWRERRHGGAPGAPEHPTTIPHLPPDDPLPTPTPARMTDDIAIRLAGVGGTGVVTVAQILGTAAMLDAWEVRGLDQTGLSQKAGPVVSDLRLTRGAPAPQSRLGTGQADVLLALDLLVAASPRALGAVHDGTRVVGSTTVVPTVQMVLHPDRTVDRDALVAAIEAVTGDSAVWADVGPLTEGLLATTTAANVFVLGMAVQAGVVPVDPARIVEAIELNGVAVDTNVAAFTWGRWYVVDPDRVRAEAEPPPTAPVVLPLVPEPLATRIADLGADDPELHEALVRRAHDLIGFQDRRLAGSWLDTVEEVAAAERAVAPGSTRLTRVVAEQLHHLLAYKDEYEVARLMLDPEGRRPADELAGVHGRVAWKLHPPLLRALGLRRKITIGTWATPVIALLARAKPLRGTALDPFGHTRVRRLERRLPDEYRACVATLLEHLDADRLDEAVRIAGLADTIRGFEELKETRAEQWRAEVAAALDAYRN